MSWAIWVGTAVAAVGAIAGGTVSGVAAAQQHNQQKENARAAELQALYNKRLAEREAARTELETAENARRQREEAEALKARQRALLGKSGAAMTSGSPLAVLGAAAADEEQKIRDIHYAGYKEAHKFREQAKMFQYEADLARAMRPSSSAKNLTIAGSAANTVGQLGSIAMSSAAYGGKKNA